MLTANIRGLITIIKCRPSSTISMSEADAQAQLANQRLKRPVSPHLSVYKVEQTWFGASAWTRITGAGLAAGFYGYSLLYLVAPLAGIHVESASIAAFVASLPLAVKGGLKFLIAWPFAFHSWNGVRHLIFDVGKGFSKKSIFYTGWGFWGLGLATALGLVALY